MDRKWHQDRSRVWRSPKSNKVLIAASVYTLPRSMADISEGLSTSPSVRSYSRNHVRIYKLAQTSRDASEQQVIKSRSVLYLTYVRTLDIDLRSRPVALSISLILSHTIIAITYNITESLFLQSPHPQELRLSKQTLTLFPIPKTVHAFFQGLTSKESGNKFTSMI